MSGEDKVKLRWIYNLSKEDVKECLDKSGITFNKSSTLDQLRKTLKEKVVQGKITEDWKELKEKATIREGAPQLNQEPSNSKQDHTEGETQQIITMTEIKTKLDFDVNQDDWETFIERLELYFLANGITDGEKQKAILLTKIGAKSYILIRDLCSPAKPKEKNYDQLVEMMKNHLNPKPSETVERFKFNQAVQKTGETVAEFVARLRKLAIYCNFSELSTMLRDRLVCGVREQDTRIL